MVQRYNFSDCQSDSDGRPEVVAEYAQAAKSRGCTFVPVLLSCEYKVNEERMISQERKDFIAGGKGMTLDTTVLQSIHTRMTIAKFRCSELLELDVTELGAKEAATRILEHLRGIGIEHR